MPPSPILQSELHAFLVNGFAQRGRVSKRQQALHLLQAVFAPYKFDLHHFLRKYQVNGKACTHFLGYLLYGLYYNEIYLPNLPQDEASKEGYFFLLLAEAVKEEELARCLALLTKVQIVQLAAYGVKYPREGAWLILNHLEKLPQASDLIQGLRQKYYLADEIEEVLSQLSPEWTWELLEEQLEQKSRLQIEKIVELLPRLIEVMIASPIRGAALLGEAAEKANAAQNHLKELFLPYRNRSYPIESVRSFFFLFGLAGFWGEQKPLAEWLEEWLDRFQNPLSLPLEQVQKVISFVLSFCHNLTTYQEKPEQYLEGLRRLVYTISSKGLSIQNSPWLLSTIKGFKALADYFQKRKISDFTFRDCPLVIFDQANRRQFKKNSEYLHQLQASTGIPIWHFAEEEILQIADRLDVKKWIVTQSTRFFGYGGARNCTFFLAPVVRRAIQQGVKSKEEFASLPLEILHQYYREAVLEARSDHIIYLGEDDLAIPTCNFFADALSAVVFQNLYFQRPSSTIGRATHHVKVVHLKTLLTEPSSLFSSTFWQPRPQLSGMKGLLSKPLFCLPLPFGDEERQAMAPICMGIPFEQPLQHLGGTRFPRAIIPETPLDGVLPYLKKYLFYSFEISLVANLVDPENQAGGCILPWNRRVLEGQMPSIHCLKDLLRFAFAPATQAEMKERFWQNMQKIFRSQNSDNPLRRHLEDFAAFDATLQGPPEILQFYATLQTDARCCLAFAALCCDDQEAGNSIIKTKKEVEQQFGVKLSLMPLTKRLLLLIQVIESNIQRF